MADQQAGSPRLYGAVIKVHDMDACRAFYEQVVGLGTPAVNSNFWVEFEVGPGQPLLALMLIHGADEAAAGGRSGVTSCVQVDDLDAYRERLLDGSVPPGPIAELDCGHRYLTLRDPEDNGVTVIEARAKRRMGPR